MRFTTYSGSLYEIDTNAKKVRRLNGKDDPTPRMGADGEWRSYIDLHPNPVAIGQSVIIVWGADVPLLDEKNVGFSPTTITSSVMEIDETVYN